MSHKNEGRRPLIGKDTGVTIGLFLTVLLTLAGGILAYSDTKGDVKVLKNENQNLSQTISEIKTDISKLRDSMGTQQTILYEVLGILRGRSEISKN